MKGLATFLSLLAVLFATVAVFSVPRREMHFTFLVYLPIHAAVTAGLWFAEQKFAFSSVEYGSIYVVLGWAEAMAVFFSCVWISLRFSTICALFFCGMSVALLMVCEDAYGRNPMAFTAFIGALFLLAGAVTLLSLVRLEDRPWDLERMAVGAFWLSEGIFHYLYVAYVTRGSKTWLARADWVPAIRHRLFFVAGLATFLSVSGNRARSDCF